MDKSISYLDESLCGTSLTGKKLENLLRNSTELNINGHQLESLHAELHGQGFASKLLRISLTWSNIENDSNVPKSLIVKVSGNNTPDEVLEKMGLEKEGTFQKGYHFVHDVECSFYEFKELRDFIPLPICYAKQKTSPRESGYLVLEDLSDRGIGMSLKISGSGINKRQLDQIVDALASLHAWSVNTDVDWRKTIPRFDQVEIILDWIDHMPESFPETKQAYPEVFQDFEYETLRTLVNRKTWMELFSDPKTRYGLPLVLEHSDCYIANYMFEKVPDREYGDKLVALLDWQATRQGCGVADLAVVALMSLSTETRRSWTDWMLERYVELFNAKVHSEANEITLENVKRAFNELFAYEAMLWSAPFLVLLSFANQTKNMTEEEKMAMQERLISYHIENFKDARRILGV